MDKRMVLTLASVLSMNVPSMGAEARNWLAPVPDKEGAMVTADVLTLKDTFISQGSRARVRLYRPDGVYEVDNSSMGWPRATKIDGDPFAERR